MSKKEKSSLKTLKERITQRKITTKELYNLKNAGQFVELYEQGLWLKMEWVPLKDVKKAVEDLVAEMIKFDAKQWVKDNLITGEDFKEQEFENQAIEYANVIDAFLKEKVLVLLETSNCDYCGGSGITLKHGDNCPVCKGTGLLGAKEAEKR